MLLKYIFFIEILKKFKISKKISHLKINKKVFYLVCIRPSLSKNKNHILALKNTWYDFAFFIYTQKFKKYLYMHFWDLIISLLNPLEFDQYFKNLENKFMRINGQFSDINIGLISKLIFKY